MQMVPGSHGLAHHSPPGDLDIERTPLALGGMARCGGEYRTSFRTISCLRSSVDRATVS